MDPLLEERRKRHGESTGGYLTPELSYGVYNFRDVKVHFSKQGWTFKPGPKLSYDHYYVKPGKDPKDPSHKQGEDYFLGEAELVAYARNMKIFGDESVPLGVGVLPPANGLPRGKRRARSCSSARTSQATMDIDSGDSDSDNKRTERGHKRHRRRSSENKVGNSAHNPIALSSDSSDEEYSGVAVESASSVEEEEWTGSDTRGGCDEEEDDDDEEEEDSSPSPSEEEEDTNDEPEEENLKMAAHSKRSVKPSTGKSRSHKQIQARDVKRKATGKINGVHNVEVKAKAETKPQLDRKHHRSAKSLDGDDEDDDDDTPSDTHKTRPLLKTSHRRGVMHAAKRSNRHNKTHSRSHSHSSSKKVAGSDKHDGKRRTTHSQHKAPQARVAKKARSAQRNLLEETNHAHDGGWEDDDDNGFDLGVDLYGESPPRRPPSRVHSRANSVKSGQSSPATSIIMSPPVELAGEQKEEEPAPGHSAHESRNTIPTSAQAQAQAQAAAAPSTEPTHSFLSSSTKAPQVATPTPPSHTKSSTDDTRASGSVWMELSQVVLPPDLDSKYHIRVTVSADKPPLHTIWMENLSSHEQREYSFTDVLELPEANTNVRMPTDTVLKALFRCLSSQPDAVVIVGPEPKAATESKPASEKGEVLLRTSTAEKHSGDTDGGGDGLTLIVAYPALDLFRVDHHFPMKLVPTDERLQHLAKEVERLREQLANVQTDRDKLCDQLRQQEEENERTLSLQVEAQVQARMAAQSAILQEQQQNQQEIERRVAELVEKKTETLVQAIEKEKRERNRAMRWVFACSDWMTAFQPCRALMAGATAETETSILRPATAASPRKYVVEWKELIEIAEPFFQPTKSDVGLTQAISIVKDGVYQVNASVCHDSVVQLRLVIRPARSGETTEIAPTAVQLYDNKRRVSRVDKMLYLRALDQLSLELELLNSTAPPQREEEWLLTPMPTHNRLLVAILDEHATHLYQERQRGGADK